METGRLELICEPPVNGPRAPAATHGSRSVTVVIVAVTALVPPVLVIIAMIIAVVVTLVWLVMVAIVAPLRLNDATGDKKTHSEQTASERDSSLARHTFLRLDGVEQHTIRTRMQAQRSCP